MVLREYNNSKAFGAIVAFIIIIVIIGVVFVPVFSALERGVSTASTFGYPSSAVFSGATGINTVYNEQGSPVSANASETGYTSSAVSGQFVCYSSNNTSDGYFKLFEFKLSSNVSSNNFYSFFYDKFYNIWKGNTSKNSISSNQSLLSFKYFYFSEIAPFPTKVAVGVSGDFTFFLQFYGNAPVNINNTAEAVFMQM
jgi:hypothetical protein